MDFSSFGVKLRDTDLEELKLKTSDRKTTEEETEELSKWRRRRALEELKEITADNATPSQTFFNDLYEKIEGLVMVTDPEIKDYLKDRELKKTPSAKTTLKKKIMNQGETTLEQKEDLLKSKSENPEPLIDQELPKITEGLDISGKGISEEDISKSSLSIEKFRDELISNYNKMKNSLTMPGRQGSIDLNSFFPKEEATELNQRISEFIDERMKMGEHLMTKMLNSAEKRKSKLN